MIDKINNLLNRDDNINWYDAYYAEGLNQSIIFKNSELQEVKLSENSGIGVRVNKNGKTGFSFTNDADMLEKTVNDSISVSNFGDKENFILPEKTEIPELKMEFWDKIDKNKEIEAGKKAVKKIKSEFPDADIDVSISFGSGCRKLINSNDINFTDEYKYYSAYVGALLVDENGVRTSTGYSCSSTLKQEIDDLVDKNIKMLRNAAKITKLESGKHPIIFTPKAFLSMLSIILSGFNGQQVYKKISPFCDKLGKKEFNEKLTIIDNPFVKNTINSYTIDDEGVLAYEKPLIESGVIKNFITNLKYASLLGMKASGNSSRSYSGTPGTSFSNLIVKNGTESSETLITSVEKGILVDQFMGLGQSNTITGEFSANLDLAFAIENGEIAGRIKDCMVSGNIYEMLKKDIELSSDVEDNSGWIIPYIKFENINFTS